ncbi:MAG: hypothetical protein A3E21_02835 [Sulfurimonas sp. RIFCSPHIGHO2_12_FULL_36_9]|uniref:energy transducer TonB family protein n=1 Tax=Sulfurimonas sp. RIFCSPLOWO2_12_36_12 TaxID=1802253 RepID=UPI0008CDFE86|nr:hypothetical protein [Sulfurimonas sp. RIFCSPLOWO2_12_36_12]OHD98478.1 MAG: hypothetical protein A3J26_05145 [Sulfurimonas sp. RIFCSPLOWO2_02_FULL_36_28]OHD98547.1 MAG: hypothetical protein A3E21_02835 [Sulfurimonas sp. RIFCSPHIGHO2_12_FULL_36_9]OHE01881.1 MAG: hypothetical protein A2W82_08865 [Sulfurimonas sp. RIFCSPLOWO2_12_36_12]OHE05900.1 MAG: hypothetical protein A3K14_04195 [Sulfurimonas sp. RIFCSPLOWO2_12_FULL_36_74]
MNRSYFALFVALLIHILLLLLIWFLGTITPEVKQQQKPKENKIKVSLKEMPKGVEKVADKKEVIKKEPVMAPPMPKGSQLKEIAEPINKPPIKYEEKIIEQKSAQKPSVNQIKTEDKKESKPKIEPIPSAKPYVTIEPKKEAKKDPLAWMSEDKSAEEVKDKKSEQQTGNNTINSDLKELYGSEFGKLTPGQQKYLIDNQEIMRRITQEILNRIARVNIRHDMNVNRTNIVEFYLHPNGDMTDFKFLQTSGYHILDTTTQETIEFAYSRYPRPAEKILVRYNVFYNLAR